MTVVYSGECPVRFIGKGRVGHSDTARHTSKGSEQAMTAYSIDLQWQQDPSSRTVLHSTALHCTALYCTVQHCTALNGTRVGPIDSILGEPKEAVCS